MLRFIFDQNIYQSFAGFAYYLLMDGGRGGSKAVWSISENSSIIVATGILYCLGS